MQVSIHRPCSAPGKPEAGHGWDQRKAEAVYCVAAGTCLAATTGSMQVPAAPALRRLLGLGGGCLEHPGNPVTTGHLREACIYTDLHTLTCTHKNLGTHRRQTAVFRLVLTCSPQQGGKANVFVPVLWRKLKLRHRGVTQSRSSSLPGEAGHVTPGQVPQSWGGPASGGTKARRAPFLLVVSMNLG